MLRQIIREKTQKQQSIDPNAKVIAVASGKGGVGKSTIVLNLGLALCQLGQRILVIDGDIGFANLDILLGVRPTHSFEQVLLGEVRLRDAITKVDHGLAILSGGAGIALQNQSELPMARFAEELKAISSEFDQIYIDLGGGLSHYSAEMISLCDEVLLVITPEPTSLADAYSLVKQAIREGDIPNLSYLINRAHSLRQASEAAGKFELALSKFLKTKANHWGDILEDDAVGRAVFRQMPFILAEPSSLASKCLLQLAKRSLMVVDAEIPPSSPGILRIWERFVKRKQS